MNHRPTVILALLALPCLSMAAPPKGTTATLAPPIFYLPFEQTVRAAVGGGVRSPRKAPVQDGILSIVNRGTRRFTNGLVGQACRIDRTPLLFSCTGNFRADEGTVSFWINPEFRGDDTHIYCTFFGAADWGMLYKYYSHTGLTFGTRRPPNEKGDLYYDCNAPGLEAWRPGQWHHVAATWSRRQNRRRIFLDGHQEAAAPFPFHQPVTSGPLFVGGGCTMYPAYAAHGQLDEFALWDRPLSPDTIAGIFERGRQHRPLMPVKESLSRPQTDATPPAGIAEAAAAELPRTARPTPATVTRESLSLDGTWSFLPAPARLDQLPANGWGTTTIPGYWTRSGTARTPDGKAAGRTWRKQPWNDLPVAYCRRTFTLPTSWKDRGVFLSIGGVDGLAELFLNGEFVATIPQWEPVLLNVARRLRFDKANTLTLVVHRRGSAPNTGVYGHVSLETRPSAFLHDWAIRPEFRPDGERFITFSCRVWAAAPVPDARLVFDVCADSAPERTVKTFELNTALPRADAGAVEVYDGAHLVTGRFPWPEARSWTFDDPFLYRVRARIYRGTRTVDVSPFQTFGFREFRIRGGGFLLNGVPTHLRGHQVDLGWSHQLENLVAFDRTGANCIELSAPIRANWYAGTPWQDELFGRVLDYADRHGIITMPPLPDARVLRNDVMRPEVARLYRRRLDKHIRRYGNHPSICLWFMSFNLAGYRWMHLQSALDGSYKPADHGWLEKERYSLAAQRIAQSLDPRPLYHHSCGNFGDIYTLNCYIGPTCPLQEREEWPSRWAEKRPFPLMACEHGLFLIPYWFRPREFPLSTVYAGEPIFDELTAKYLGPDAYRLITPEVFELYDLDRAQPRPDRTRALATHHPGYQRVKSLFARRSLRAWRVWGVSGIIFNAISWDFDDEKGNPLPVRKALTRWFGDTDLVLTGPGADWPAKDHAFFAGEPIRKQAVLINDLTHPLAVILRWKLADPAGTVLASGTHRAVARPGQPTAVPIAVDAPVVRRRTAFRLSVSAAGPNAGLFQPDTLDFAVFPKPGTRPKIARRVLVYDPVGDTRRLLDAAGVAASALTETQGLGTGPVLVIVGRKAWDSKFAKIAGACRLFEALRAGRADLVVFEQTSAAGSVFGLDLVEQSARRVFAVDLPQPLLAGLDPADFIDLRGSSDLMPARPKPPPETEKKWPRRYFKWGNRGIVATFVYRKPHFGPFRPVLECGFDLTDSPLLEARIGRGRVILCNVDCTLRYGKDPVSTRLLSNLLTSAASAPAVRSGDHATARVRPVGENATRLLQRFGIANSAAGTSPETSVWVVGDPGADPAPVLDAVRHGANALLLPEIVRKAADRFGLRTSQSRYFVGRRAGDSDLVTGISAGDLYLKQWTTGRAVREQNGWHILVSPGLLAEKRLGKGRLVACAFPIPGPDPEKSHAGVKELRFWDLLLTNLNLPRRTFSAELRPTRPLTLPNPWEQVPPYINW